MRLAYELGGLFEPSVGLPEDADFPLAWLARIPAAILYNRESGRCVLMAESGQAALIDALALDLAQTLPRSRPCRYWRHFMKTIPLISWQVWRVSRITFALAMYSRSTCRADGRRIRSGSRACIPDGTADAEESRPLFRAAADGRLAIVSSSPERLVRLGRDGVLETRPIAGTHPRSDDAEEVAALRARLQAIPRNVPSTSCSSIWSATTWAVCASPAA